MSLPSGKHCDRCEVFKPYLEFARSEARRDAHDIYCKDCRKEMPGHAVYEDEAGKVVYKPNSKWCPKCQRFKLFEAFSRNKSTRDGYSSYCRECYKKVKKQSYDSNKARQYYSPDRHREKRYGLTVPQMSQLRSAQNNRCAICRCVLVNGGRKLTVDHCHDSGKVRGLLCSNCNTGLGLLKDDPAIVEKAREYLAKHSWMKGGVK